jgi:succinate dehydrogenase / fumarate reductase iron-sulfur subunit
VKINLKIWRQKNLNQAGKFELHTLDHVEGDMSLLEVIDILNVDLVKKGGEPFVYESDCREGICGSCSMVIDGEPHGPVRATTTCQLFMRTYKDGATIVVEPFRAKAFPLIQDLMVDRSAFDRIQHAGGYNSVRIGNAPEANSMLVPKAIAERAFEAATCIGCGACVAVCKNSSAMLFTSAKVVHLALLPQGQAEKEERVLKMVAQMDAEGFGNCTNTLACEATCPKEISVDNIGIMNKEFRKAMANRAKSKANASGGGDG